jgi:hypothetical protein
MKKIIGILIASCALGGCVSWWKSNALWGKSKTGIDTLEGQPLSAALERLGYPSRDQNLDGEHVIRWDLTYFGYVCHLTIEVDRDDIIKKYHYDGDAGGCDKYVQALKK